MGALADDDVRLLVLDLREELGEFLDWRGGEGERRRMSAKEAEKNKRGTCQDIPSDSSGSWGASASET